MKQSDREENKPKRRFSEEQYQMLLRCSEKKDTTEWNEWRKVHWGKDILLEGADLSECNLRGILLGTELESGFTGQVHLEGVDLFGGNLEKADFNYARLKGARLEHANLKGAYLSFAHLQKANLGWANLENAELMNVRLENAKLRFARLQGADIAYAHLQNAEFPRATVDGCTSLWECKVNHKTNFRGVALYSVQIDPGTRQLLEYNVRRMNWEEWYKGHWFWRWPVQLFWAMSDYGMSTVRVVGVFFILAFLFAAVYMNWAYWAPPGIVDKLIVQPEVGEAG